MATNNGANEPKSPFLSQDYGIPPELWDAFRRGSEAKKQANLLKSKYESAQSLSGAELGGVQGRGLAATAPTLANAISVLAQRYTGAKQKRNIEKQLANLQGDITEADLAQLALKLKPKQQSELGRYRQSPEGIYDTTTGEVVREFDRPEKDRIGSIPSGYRLTEGDTLEYIPGGPADPDVRKNLKPQTESGKKAAGFLGRMLNAKQEIVNLSATAPSFDPAGNTERLLGLTNITATPEMQRYRQAANDWIRAKLRKESGAVIGEEEMASEFKTYFPQVGDSQAVQAQKARARAQAEAAMRIEAGAEQPKQQNSDDIEGILKDLGV